ncbi:MAG: hypothetical protein QM697_02240 [Lachnospiraceae bacterium]
MSVNGISGYSQSDAYSAYAKAAKSTEDTGKKNQTPVSSAAEETGVIYEKSADTDAVAAAKTKYQPNTAVIEMLKSDAASRQESLLKIVREAVTGQGNALAQSDSIWSFLASGNFTVTAAAKQEAQKAISEGGYWSVENTSDRIIEMAKALTGGDPDKLEEMRSAFEKGFKEATKSWGKELPEISSKTYDSVMSKFDKWAAESQAQNTAAGVI